VQRWRAQLNATRPIRIIVPFAPAGSSDVLARLLQSPLQQALGQTVIVENRAGAGANIGMVEAARAEPDGTTLLLTSSALLVNPALYKNGAYDPAKDFAPIATLPVAPNILAVNAKAAIRSLSEVVARAKAEPGKLNYASPGNGTTPQLAMELFKLKARHISSSIINDLGVAPCRGLTPGLTTFQGAGRRASPQTAASRRPGRSKNWASLMRGPLPCFVSGGRCGADPYGRAVRQGQ
jgi:tripartite-type tricarboxylate transporter receptor subunit TctC